jgi:guanidinopropionase
MSTQNGLLRAQRRDGPEGLDIAIAGIPFDAGSYIGTGQRFGPNQAREFSWIVRPVHALSGRAPFDQCRIADIGDAPIDLMDPVKSIRDATDFFARVAEAGAAPLGIGGDHTVTLPIMRGMVQGGVEAPFGLIHFDAHPDTYDEVDGNRINCATNFRRAIEEGLVDPKRYVMIGIRVMYDIACLEWAKDQGVTVITDDDCADLGRQGVIDKARAVVGDGPTFVSFDIDGLDMAYVRGTQSPEPGELTAKDAMAILRGFSGLDIIGGDVDELLPPKDPSGHTAIVTLNLAFEILCLIAESRARK